MGHGSAARCSALPTGTDYAKMSVFGSQADANGEWMLTADDLPLTESRAGRHRGVHDRAATICPFMPALKRLHFAGLARLGIAGERHAIAHIVEVVILLLLHPHDLRLLGSLHRPS